VIKANGAVRSGGWAGDGSENQGASRQLLKLHAHVPPSPVGRGQLGLEWVDGIGPVSLQAATTTQPKFFELKLP
jgi:hypothetical protein